MGRDGETRRKPGDPPRAPAALAGILAERDGAASGCCRLRFPVRLSRRVRRAGSASRDAVARGLGRDRPPADDGADNRNNRFAVAAELNRRVSGGAFPFWGCPVRMRDEFLGPSTTRGTCDDGLAEQRLIDRWMVGAQPCWKLACTGSVGGQALTGIPVVRALRDDPRWADRARIWPFETGLGAARRRSHRLRRGLAVMVAGPAGARPAQRQGPGAHRRRASSPQRDRAGELARMVRRPPDPDRRSEQIIESEEAWTLGVTAPRVRSLATATTGADRRPSPRSRGERKVRRAAMIGATPISAIRRRSIAAPSR